MNFQWAHSKISQIAFGVFCWVFSLSVQAAYESPLRDALKLQVPVGENAVKVQGARILTADYELIRKDFPDTESMSKDEIDQWLLDRAGFIAETQAHQNDVNDEVPTVKDANGNPVRVTALRPERYGRALVFQDGEGLIDSKGAGATSPKRYSHRTGLSTLSEAMREFIFEKAIQKVLQHSGSNLKTIGSYAVIDWGFQMHDMDGQITRAGAVLRQGHTRRSIPMYYADNHFADISTTAVVEWVLLHYGFSSTGDSDYDGKPFLRANVQESADGYLLDFGTYLARFEEVRPVTHYYYSIDDVLIDKKVVENIRSQWTDEQKANLYLWSSVGHEKENPRYDRVWVGGNNISQRISAGQTFWQEEEQFVQHFLSHVPLSDHLKNAFPDLTTNFGKQKVVADILRSSLKTKAKGKVKYIAMPLLGWLFEQIEHTKEMNLLLKEIIEEVRVNEKLTAMIFDWLDILIKKPELHQDAKINIIIMLQKLIENGQFKSEEARENAQRIVDAEKSKDGLAQAIEKKCSSLFH